MADGTMKRVIPVTMGDNYVIDSEFRHIKERFEAEMKKMEDEMARFRLEHTNKESNFFSNTSTTSNTSSTITNQDSRAGELDNSWLEGPQSSLTETRGDNKILKLRFDARQYEPEEIVVKTIDNKLLVHAKHEEKSENKSVFREFNREFLLPKGTNLESIKSTLSKDGILTVEAELPPSIDNSDRMILGKNQVSSRR